MSKKIRKEVFNRIIFAKKLFKDGELSCNIENDQMIFAKGLLLLHDATDNALGAIADHIGVKLKGNTYILKYFEIIKEADPQNRTLPYMTQIRNLTTIRNNIKHQGIFPDIKSNAHFPSTVYQLITDICQTYLKIDFNSISLINLLSAEILKKMMKQAEVSLKKKKYRECQINCRKTLYLVFEKKFDIRPFEKYKEDIQIKSALARAISRPYSLAPEHAKNKQYIKENVKQPTDFIVIDDNKMWRDLLGNGINLVDFSNVMLLTPKVYFFEEEKDWATKEDVDGIKYNQENAEYCFRKTIEILLIKQNNIEREKGFLARELKSTTIKNKEINVLKKASLKVNVVYKMKKNLPYELRIMDEVRGLDSKNKYYYILGSKEKDKGKDKGKFVYFYGYVLKNDLNEYNLK